MSPKSKRRSARGRKQAPLSWRLPASPISKPAAAGALSGVVFFLAILLVTPPLWSSVKTHPYFLLGSIEVEGNLRISDEEIIEFAGVRTGQSLWDVSTRTVALRVEAHPWIQKAKARIEAAGKAVIEVEERKPMAIVRFDELHYVDRRGHLLGPLSREDSRNFPMITGLEQGTQRAFAPVALPRTAQLLRWCERRGTINDLSEVHVDREAGITLFPAETNVAVELGWGRWTEKLNRSARVFAAWKERLDRLAAIDVSLPEMVIVRLRQEDKTEERQAKPGRQI